MSFLFSLSNVRVMVRLSVQFGFLVIVQQKPQETNILVRNKGTKRHDTVKLNFDPVAIFFSKVLSHTSGERISN